MKLGIKKRVGLVHILLASVMSLGCDLVKNAIGPPLPKRDARTYLEAIGKSSDDINALVNHEDIGEKHFVEYSECDSSSVRYLVARNPHIPLYVLEKLTIDEVEYVRQGASENIKLPVEYAKRLSKDSSNRVLGGLVRNPSVPKTIILEIRKTNKKVQLIDYAMNPDCPESIREEIYRSGDKLAIRWLGLSKRNASEKAAILKKASEKGDTD